MDIPHESCSLHRSIMSSCSASFSSCELVSPEWTGLPSLREEDGQILLEFQLLMFPKSTNRVDHTLQQWLPCCASWPQKSGLS